MTKCKKMTFEDAQVGRLCVAESPDEPGLWTRAVIKNRIATNDSWEYKIFFVDFGDQFVRTLDKLRKMPNEFISRLPFQAIACSLRGVKPTEEATVWSDPAIDFFYKMTRTEDDGYRILHATPEEKLSSPDAVTNGSHYTVAIVNRAEANGLDLAQAMVDNKFAVAIENKDDFHQSVALSDAHMAELAERRRKGQMEKDLNRLIEDEGEFEGWDRFMDIFFPGLNKARATSPLVAEINSEPISVEAPVTVPATTLYDHTMPLRVGASLFPTAQWTQNTQSVIVNFRIHGVTPDYKLTITEDHLSFSADVEEKKYDSFSSYDIVFN